MFAPIQFSCCAGGLVMIRRKRIAEAFHLNDADEMCKPFCCYPCAIWKHYVSLSEIQSFADKNVENASDQQGSAPAGGVPGMQTPRRQDEEEPESPVCYVNGEPVYEEKKKKKKKKK